MSFAPLHIHFDTRREAHPVYQLSEDRIDAAFQRRPDLAGQVKLTITRNQENIGDHLKTANILMGAFLPKELIRTGAPWLKNIHVIGAGVEYLYPMDWLPPTVVLTNSRGVHQQKGAESILLLVLMLNNNIPAFATAQRNALWNPLYSTSLKGKTALVVGVGELGGAAAAQLRSHGLRIIGIRRSGVPHRNCDETHGPDKLNAMLPRADFVVLTAPLTRETEGLIGKTQFDLMKTGAGLLNFCRAKVCDYRALKDALSSGKLSGAISDVFDPDPLPSDSYLWTVPNLFIVPHCLSSDPERYIAMSLDLVFENAARLLSSKPLINVVDVERGY